MSTVLKLDRQLFVGIIDFTGPFFMVIPVNSSEIIRLCY